MSNLVSQSIICRDRNQGLNRAETQQLWNMLCQMRERAERYQTISEGDTNATNFTASLLRDFDQAMSIIVRKP
jgi:hypothetical protein